MGRVLLIARLAARDLRRRPAEAVMVLLVIAAAATTLTAGLALNGVTGHSGPYPYTYTVIRAGGHIADVTAEGRDLAPARVDQPELTQGSWVRPGGVVIERGFADALGVHAGDRVTLDGRSLRVAGIAVTAGIPAYPSSLCHLACAIPASMMSNSQGAVPDIGLVWLTRPDAGSLATSSAPLSYLLNLKLANPAQAPAFATAHRTTAPAAPLLYSWQSIRDQDNGVVQTEQIAMQFGGWLLGLLALAGLAVLVGRRMTEQTRRVGLLKAVGATPGLVAAVLLAEHMALALCATAAGLVAGRLTAPLLTSTG